MKNFRQIGDNIQEVVLDNPRTPDEKLTWTNIVNAGKTEIEYLRKTYGFSLLHLQASLKKSTSQRPQITTTPDYHFLILHFPLMRDGKLEPGEIEFFIGPNFLVTLHNNNLKAIGDFFNLCKKDGNSTMAFCFESSSILLGEILEKLILSCYGFLDESSIAIEKIERMIFAHKQKRAVSHILDLRLNIINFRKIMQNHKNIIKKMIETEAAYAPNEPIKPHYLALIDHTKRIWEILENQKETVEVLNGTNESLLNYRISDIMKTLTIFSVIVFPLTLLAAIFGMNTVNGMPFMENENGFWMIIAIMLTGCLCMILFFARKKWL